MIGAWFDYTRTRVQDCVTDHVSHKSSSYNKIYFETKISRGQQFTYRSVNKQTAEEKCIILAFEIPAQRQFKNGDAYRISSTRTVKFRCVIHVHSKYIIDKNGWMVKLIKSKYE